MAGAYGLIVSWRGTKQSVSLWEENLKFYYINPKDCFVPGHDKISMISNYSNKPVSPSHLLSIRNGIFSH